MRLRSMFGEEGARCPRVSRAPSPPPLLACRRSWPPESPVPKPEARRHGPQTWCATLQLRPACLPSNRIARLPAPGTALHALRQVPSRHPASNHAATSHRSFLRLGSLVVHPPICFATPTLCGATFGCHSGRALCERPRRSSAPRHVRRLSPPQVVTDWPPAWAIPSKCALGLSAQLQVCYRLLRDGKRARNSIVSSRRPPLSSGAIDRGPGPTHRPARAHLSHRSPPTSLRQARVP